MNRSFNLLFLAKRSKMNKNGLIPIFLRITIDGERLEISTKRHVNLHSWNADRQKVNGSTEDVKSVNAHLKTMEHQIYEVYREMIDKNYPLTVMQLKKNLLGDVYSSNAKMLVPIFEEHNDRIKSLVGKEYAAGTHDG